MSIQGTVGIYVDGNWVGGSPYAWNTVAVSNGSHGLLCNGYVNGSPDGSAGENVTVSNAGAPPSLPPGFEQRIDTEPDTALPDGGAVIVGAAWAARAATETKSASAMTPI